MRRARRTRDERGAMAIEFLLVISALMLVFLLMLQYAVKAHAQRVAEAAAEEALAAASAYDGSATAGEASRQALPQRPRRACPHTNVTVTRTGSTATVTVTGDVEQLFPFLPVHVTVRVEGPVETVRGDAMRRDERGAMAIELVILTPALVAAIMVIAAGARYVDARGQTNSAAFAAARAASLTTNQEAAVAGGDEGRRDSR